MYMIYVYTKYYECRDFDFIEGSEESKDQGETKEKEGRRKNRTEERIKTKFF